MTPALKDTLAAETPCRVDPDAWFDPLISGHPGRPNAARRLCEGCPVTVACLLAALDIERGLPSMSRYGVWGGTVPAERARIEAGDMARPESAA